MVSESSPIETLHPKVQVNGLATLARAPTRPKIATSLSWLPLCITSMGTLSGIGQ